MRHVQLWRNAGCGAYLSVARPEQLRTFERTGLLPAVGLDCLIRRDRHHVMKDILNPYTAAPASHTTTTTEEEITVQALAQRLHATPLFGPVPIRRLSTLLDDQPIRTAERGDIIVRADERLNDHLVLLEGGMEAQRTWSVPGGCDKSYTWTLKPDSADGGPAILTAASRRLRARALTNLRYLHLDVRHDTGADAR